MRCTLIFTAVFTSLLISACGSSGGDSGSNNIPSEDGTDSGVDNSGGVALPPDPTGTDVPPDDGEGDSNTPDDMEQEPSPELGFPDEDEGPDTEPPVTDMETVEPPGEDVEVPVVMEPVEEPVMEPVMEPVDEQVEPVKVNDATLEAARAFDIRAFTADNFQDVLAAIVTLYRAGAMVDAVGDILSLERDVAAGTSALSPLNITETGFDRIHTCPNSGRLLASIPEDNDRRGISRFNFDACTFNEGGPILGINGPYTFQPERNPLDTSPEGLGTASLSGFSIAYSDSSVVSFGLASIGETRISVDGNLARTHGVQGGIGLLRVDEASNTLVEDLTIAYLALSHGRAESFDGTVTIGRTTAGEIAQITQMSVTLNGDRRSNVAAGMTTSFQAEQPGANYRVGQLEVTLPFAADGAASRLVMQADNGDPNTFDAFIFNADNTVTSFTVDWAPRFRFEAPALFAR